jgi:hypothetical protein
MRRKAGRDGDGLTKIEAPAQIVNADFGELRDDEATHPVRSRRGSSTPCPPANGVDFRVVHPWELGETGPVEEVVQEEHRRRDITQLGLRVVSNTRRVGLVYSRSFSAMDHSLQHRDTWLRLSGTIPWL